MGQSMKVSGKMINKMVMVKRNGKMEHFMKEIINRERNLEKEILSGEMVVHMKVIFMIMLFMVKVNIHGKMIEFMRVIGTIIKCMEKVLLFGQMVVDIKVSMLMIKNMVLVFLHLRMVVYMRVNGRMENNMVEVNIKRKKLFGKVFGNMEYDQNGLGINKMKKKNLKVRKKIMIYNEVFFSILLNFFIFLFIIMSIENENKIEIIKIYCLSLSQIEEIKLIHFPASEIV
jgi:hypothetical protein